jgi:transcription elongation factor GreA
MENEKVYVTLEGVERLRQELKYLIDVRRPALAERLRQAIQQGDLTENADYQTAKEEQAFLEGRIQQLETMLLDAVIIEEGQGPKDQVGLGSRVTVIEEGEEQPEVFLVVGSAESDPASGRISHASPLGQALMQRKVGERVTVQAPAGKMVFIIKSIE